MLNEDTDPPPLPPAPILSPSLQDVREMLNMKIFVDTDDDVRLARRIKVGGRRGSFGMRPL